MEQFVPRRLTKRQDPSALKSTVEDVLKLLLDPTMKAPTFYAVDLCRLPPVGAENCDVSAILKELHSLRHEVRVISQLQDEVSSIRQELAAL